MVSRKRLFIGLILLLILLISIKRSLLETDGLKNNIISKQKNYMVSYNAITESNINNIARYDIAILEPLNITSKQLLKLKNSKTITYGYQSIVEVEQYNTEKNNLLKEDDYLYVDGVKLFNEHYQCYYGDIRSPHYRQVLLDSIENNVINKGFDGVFFDTLDDIEFFIEEPLRTELFMEYIKFFKLLNTKYPKLSIIQNRAFNLYTLGSGEYIDALMYEGIEYEMLENPDTAEFYNNLVDRLSKTSQETNSIILGMAYKDPLENYEMAKSLNWLYYYYPPDNQSLKNKDPIHNIKIRPRYRTLFGL